MKVFVKSVVHTQLIVKTIAIFENVGTKKNGVINNDASSTNSKLWN